MNKMENYMAYCYRSGLIKVGRKAPKRTIVLGTHPDRRVLIVSLRGLVRMAHDGKTMLIPGIPETDSMDAKFDALKAFGVRLRKSLLAMNVDESEHQLEANVLFSAVKPAAPMTAPLRVVLHQSHKGDGEWVTHIQNMENKGFNYGHYFDSYPEAMVDYIARCYREGVIP